MFNLLKSSKNRYSIRYIIGILFTIFLGLSSSQAVSQPRGVGLDRTRVIISDGAKEGSLGVNNYLDSEILVSMWVEDIDGNKTEKVIAAPALFRLPAKRSSRTRLVITDALPQDKESVFYVVTNSLPSDKDFGKSSKMQFIVSQRLKLFYRPKNLEGNCMTAAQSLQWSRDKNYLIVTNPSKLSVSFVNIKVATNVIKDGTVLMPGETKQWKLKTKSNQKVEYKIVDEYGGLRALSSTL